jgi:uncharacterized protein YjbI with pentapeptide repeats
MPDIESRPASIQQQSRSSADPVAAAVRQRHSSPVREIYTSRPRPVSVEAQAAAAAAGRPLSYADEVALPRPAESLRNLPLVPPHARAVHDDGPNLPSPDRLPSPAQAGSQWGPANDLTLPDELAFGTRPGQEAGTSLAHQERETEASIVSLSSHYQLSSGLIRVEHHSTHTVGAPGWAGVPVALGAESRDVAMRMEHRREHEAELREAELRDAERRLAAHREAAHHEAARREAELHAAELREVEYREAARREADRLRREVALREAELREAALREADLREAALREAALREAALREAQLREAERREAETRLAELPLRQAELLKREAELRHAEFLRHEAELHAAELRESEYREAAHHEAALRDAKHRHDAELARREADLRDAELREEEQRRETELRQAELRRVSKRKEEELHQAELALKSCEGHWDGSGSRFLGTKSGYTLPPPCAFARRACTEPRWAQLRKGGCRFNIPRDELASRA